MGRQSSRIYFQGKDHKDIYFQGHYHDKMYIGSQLVWEKLKDKGWIFNPIGYTYFGESGNGYFVLIGESAHNNSTLYFELLVSKDAISWEKYEYTVPHHFVNVSGGGITGIFFFNGYFYIVTYDYGFNDNGEYDDSAMFRTKDGSSIENVAFSEMNFSILGRNLSVSKSDTIPYLSVVKIESIGKKALIRMSVVNNKEDSIYYAASFYFESSDFKNWEAKGVNEKAYTSANTEYVKMAYRDVCFVYGIGGSANYSYIAQENGYYYGVGGKTESGLDYKEVQFIRTSDFHTYEVINVPSDYDVLPYKYSNGAKIGGFYRYKYIVGSDIHYAYTSDFETFYIDDFSHFIKLDETSPCHELKLSKGIKGDSFSVYAFETGAHWLNRVVVIDNNGNVIDESEENEVISSTAEDYYRTLCIGDTFVISNAINYTLRNNGIYYRKMEE